MAVYKNDGAFARALVLAMAFVVDMYASAVPVTRSAQFPVTLPALGSNSTGLLDADYTTILQNAVALDPTYDWQVGLAELQYPNTVFTISTGNNVVTLYYAGTALRVEITPGEYLSPDAFVERFNDDITDALNAERQPDGAFPANATLRLAYDTTTLKMSLTHLYVSFEILAQTGGDLLRLMGRAADFGYIRDMPATATVTYAFPPFQSDLNLSLVDFIRQGQTDNNSIVHVRVYDALPQLSSMSNFVDIQVNLKLSNATTANVKGLADVLNAFNQILSTAINNASLQLLQTKYSGCRGSQLEQCTQWAARNIVAFSVVPSTNVVVITSRRVDAWIDYADGSFLLRYILATTGSGIDPFGTWRSGSGDPKPSEPSDLQPSTIWTADRDSWLSYRNVVRPAKDTFTISVLHATEQRFVDFTVTVATRAYVNQSDFVNGLNTAVQANTALMAALTAVGGIFRAELTPSTLFVHTYMCNWKITCATGMDVQRLIGLREGGGGDLHDDERYAYHCLGWNAVKSPAWQHTITFQNITPLVQMPRNLNVYLPDLVADSLVGGYETAPIRSIQMDGDFRTVQIFEPRNIYWHSVAPTGMRIDRIHVCIRNAFGDIVKFQWGHVTVTLLFRPVAKVNMPLFTTVQTSDPPKLSSQQPV